MGTYVQNVVKLITSHSSYLGQIWYLLALGLRVLVLSTVSRIAYSDEQQNFHCLNVQNDMKTCTLLCYDEFIKVSHEHFWMYQIIAISIPVLIFYLYLPCISTKFKNFKSNEKLTEGPLESTKLTVENFVYLLFRLIIEVASMFIGSSIFNIKDGTRMESYSFSQYAWMAVPQMYECKGLKEITRAVCRLRGYSQRKLCWVPSFYEKTFIVRFLNILSIICAVITLLEIFWLYYRDVRSKKYSKNIHLNRFSVRFFQSQNSSTAAITPAVNLQGNMTEIGEAINLEDQSSPEHMYETV